MLDVVRAAAVILVLGRHLGALNLAVPQCLRPLTLRWIHVGWTGVDLFFVLSGFLVSGLLFQEFQRHGKIRVGRFLVRRAFKIYPSFYVFVAAVVYVQWSNGARAWATPRQILAECFFVQNYFPGLLGHTWSLAIEEHFYLLLPILLLTMMAMARKDENPFRRLPVVFILVSSLLLGLRIWRHFSGPYDMRGSLMVSHLRLDSLLCGVLLSYYYHFYTARTLAFARRFRWLLLATAAALLTPVCFVDPPRPYMHTVGFAANYVAFALILLAALTFSFPTRGVASLPFRALAFCGAYSYGIYLWHLPVQYWGAMYLTRWFGWSISPRENLLVYLGGTFVVGIIFSMAIEIPFLALRDWWFPSKSRAVEPSERGFAVSPAKSPVLTPVAVRTTD